MPFQKKKLLWELIKKYNKVIKDLQKYTQIDQIENESGVSDSSNSLEEEETFSKALNHQQPRHPRISISKSKSEEIEHIDFNEIEQSQSEQSFSDSKSDQEESKRADDKQTNQPIRFEKSEKSTSLKDRVDNKKFRKV